jgi:hypothetical protein
MQEADASNVLGDFSNATFDYFGSETRFTDATTATSCKRRMATVAPPSFGSSTRLASNTTAAVPGRIHAEPFTGAGICLGL